MQAILPIALHFVYFFNCKMTNYFKLFNIGESFIVNAAELKRQFLLLSKQYHPDFFVAASDSEKEEALQLSASINKAYKILSNVNSTIEYVLALNGILEKDEKYNLPQDFLMEMMEINEQLIDAKLDNDVATLETLRTQISNLQTKIYAPIKDYIETYNENLYSQEGMLQVKEYYFKMKYLERLKESL